MLLKRSRRIQGVYTSNHRLRKHFGDRAWKEEYGVPRRRSDGPQGATEVGQTIIEQGSLDADFFYVVTWRRHQPIRW